MTMPGNRGVTVENCSDAGVFLRRYARGKTVHINGRHTSRELVAGGWAVFRAAQRQAVPEKAGGVAHDQTVPAFEGGGEL